MSNKAKKVARKKPDAAKKTSTGKAKPNLDSEKKTSTRANKSATRSREKNEVAGRPVAATKFSRVGVAMQAAMRKAFDNVVRLGDTDVFPRSFETFLLDDLKDEVLELLAEIHGDFTGALISSPPVNDKVLAAVGYSGFRPVTQVDPIWNLYLLSLVISLGSNIESARVISEKKIIHSYRYQSKKNDPHIFNSEYGWFSFSVECERLAKEHKYVLLTDISDYYPRIYHHRLENALKKVTTNTSSVKRIIQLLTEFSGGVSYGLPVGGPAARLLSELLLNSTDRMLLAEGVKYARFVDDFRIFADSREEAHASLVLLAQKIGESEGLSLQKSKTRIMSSEEYLSITSGRPDEDDGAEQSEYRRFMSIKIHFDPYSESAKEDYDSLRESLKQFDIVGMLVRELRKTQIEEGVVRKLVRSVRHLSVSRKNACVSSMVESLEVLSPVFPLVMQVVAAVFNELEDESKKKAIAAIKKLFVSNSHIVQVPVNQSFAIRVLALSIDEESEQILYRVYRGTSSIGVKRDVIIAMANWDLSWFISDRRRNYQNLSSWERRAVLAASYMLEDEGDHWRKKLTLSRFDSMLTSWVAKRKVAGNGKVVLPL